MKKETPQPFLMTKLNGKIDFHAEIDDVSIVLTADNVKLQTENGLRQGRLWIATWYEGKPWVRQQHFMATWKDPATGQGARLGTKEGPSSLAAFCDEMATAIDTITFPVFGEKVSVEEISEVGA